MADKMYVAHVRADFQTPTGIQSRWKEDPVELIADGKDIRCAHCHGAVKVHRKRKPTGTADHVEHRKHRDSEHCRAGYYFKGDHRLSDDPVL